MTATNEAPAVPMIPEDLHDEAENLICDLAAAAGSPEDVYAALRAYCSVRPQQDAAAGIAAALLITFTECIPDPLEPGEIAELSLPTTEGANDHV